MSDIDTQAKVYELRQLLQKAVRALRDAEDLTRLDPHWSGYPTADRIRSIYEQITDDVLEGRTSIPPLKQRLAIAEDNLTLVIRAWERGDSLEDTLKKLR